MEEAIAKAGALIEAMEYIRKFRGKIVVVKLGGSVLEDTTLQKKMLTDIAFMSTVGMQPIIVHGGGIYCLASSPTISNCVISANVAEMDGGGMCISATCNPRILYCTFIENLAGRYGEGGGLVNYRANPTLTNCVFIRNSATYGGGGISTWMGSMILANCTFSGNSTQSAGGGMCDSSSDSGPILTNCVFTGNSAQRDGGALFSVWSSPVLINCTVASNWAFYDGDGIYVDTSTTTLKNCILWGNAGNIFDEDMYAINAIVTVTFSDVQHTSTYWDTVVDLGTGSMNVDPCFMQVGHWVHTDDPNTIVEPSHAHAFWVDGDYHLKSQAGRWEPSSGRWAKDDVTSPCIDAGDAMSPIGHEPFPNGGIINMGAYGGTAEASKSYFGEPVCEVIIAGDINGDCKVDFADFALMAQHWLQESR